LPKSGGPWIFSAASTNPEAGMGQTVLLPIAEDPKKKTGQAAECAPARLLELRPDYWIVTVTCWVDLPYWLTEFNV
jgi:hypothetical protein